MINKVPRILKIKTAVVQANFLWTYVRVYADDGYGTGECYFAPGLTAMICELGELLTGEDYRNIEHLVEKMRWAASGAGSLSGLIWNAITGVEAALWDLKGKHYGLPVYQLLGGKFREEVRLYLDCHAAGALESLTALLQPFTPQWAHGEPASELSRDEIVKASAERAVSMVQLGYTALKFDLDLPDTSFSSSSGYTITSRDIDWMTALVHRVREAVGPDVDLAFDAHWRYRPNEILQVAKELECCRLMWLEDPVPPQ
ncbi:MAG: mandelate racemase/muconate lactonizing enzyme family protein, partial [Acidobacteriota bacterium]|nr:mandelate racemase/muconate lactonizing enzyme family protein [Acidobacteriota bacterium]